MARIVFMGTPEFAVPSLEKLFETQDVIGVVTQPDRPAGRGRQLQAPPVKVAAQAKGIPIYQPKSLRSDEAATPLREWAPELIVVAAFGQILRSHVLELPPKGCLNVHASLLPRWRGASPIQHTILAGDKETGVSLMKMDEGMDTGPIYVQQAIPIRPHETASELHDRLAQLGAEVLGRHLDNILSGDLKPVSQEEELATYAPLIKKQSGEIDWQQSSEQIDRHVRAMTPWPGAFSSWRGTGLKVLMATPLSDVRLPAGQPGNIVSIQDKIVVLAGDGGIQLKRIQLAGKRATDIDEFLHGQPEFVGSHLPS